MRSDGRAAILLRLLGAAMASWAQQGQEGDSGVTREIADAGLWIDAISQEWELQPDFATVRANVKMLLVKRHENQSTASCGPFNSAEESCFEVWLSDNTNCDIFGHCAERPPWQQVVEQSIFVSGAAHATTFAAEGNPLPSYRSVTTVDKDRFRLRIVLGRRGSWKTHSVHISYEIANALCVAEKLGWGGRRLPPGLASRGDAEVQPNAHRFQFDASWANWLETPVVRDISYALVLPAPASLWSDSSPALLSPSQDTNASSFHLPHVTDQGQMVLRRSFTPEELGIHDYAATRNVSAVEKLIFTWATSPSSGIPVIVNHTLTPPYDKAYDAATHRSCSYPKPPFNTLEHDSPLLMVFLAFLIAGGSCFCCCCCCERSPSSRASGDPEVQVQAHLVIRYSAVFAFDLYTQRARPQRCLRRPCVWCVCVCVRARKEGVCGVVDVCERACFVRMQCLVMCAVSG